MALDITGIKFGRLTAIKFIEKRNGRDFWLFKCDCGKEKIIRKSHVTSLATLSCGCLNKEATTKHGFGNKKNKIYRLWEQIKRRTLNKNFKQFKDYGGRGIKICDEWKYDFLCFYDWCISNGYKEGLLIDRIDNNGNYEPKNCRFCDRKAQQRNRRNNVIIEYNNEKKCLAEWCECKNIKYGVLRARIFSYGWSIERALNESSNRI